MTLTIHQPSYWPWLGLLDKIAKADKLIILDDVEINKASFQFRNQFYCNGEAKYISLPINFRKNTKINVAKFKNDKWASDHLNKLVNYYRKAPYFNQVFPQIEDLYQSKSQLPPYLFVIETTLFLMEHLHISTQTELSSESIYDGKKGDLVFNICEKNQATNYLSGQGAKDYMDERIFNKFVDNKINIHWHEFNHPTYSQVKKYPFVSGLAGLDILFFQGFEKARDIFQMNLTSTNNG